MNRKLKKLLKNTYGAKPQRKNPFIAQLRHNPVWRRLHPISSFIKIPPAYVLIPTIAAAAAIGAGIIAYNLSGKNDSQPVYDNVSVVSETAPEVSEVTEYTSLTASVKLTSSVPSKSSTSLSKSSSAVPHGAVKNPSAETANNYTQTTVTTAETKATTSTSVYYTHLYDHINNISDLRNHYEDIKNNQNMPGYPDYNYFEDMLRLIFEESGKDYDELTQELGDYFKHDLTYEVLNGVFSLKKPPVIEGKTVNIEYTAYDGKPWTVCEVKISEVYNYDIKHVFSRGDKVKIAMPGGYMTVREYIELNPGSKLFSGWTDEKINSTVIYEDGSNQNEPKIGDIFTYIISYDENIPGFPVEGCLTRFSLNDMAQFTRSGDRFTSCNSNFSDMYFTLDQINENQFEFTHVFNDPDSGRSIGIKDNSLLLYGQFDCYSISEDGKTVYLDVCYTDRGFYPFNDESDYSVTWTDKSVIIKYRTDYMSDKFETKEFYYPMRP